MSTSRRFTRTPTLAAANDLSDKYQRAHAVLGLASKCLEDSAAKPTPKKKQNRER